MKQETKTKLFPTLKAVTYLGIATLLLSSIFISIYNAKHISWEQEREGFEENISQLDSNLQSNVQALNEATAINSEVQLLFLELQKAQNSLKHINEIAKTVVDTMSLRLEKEDIGNDWDFLIKGLWNLELEDTINYQMRNEIVPLLEKGYNAVWNNRTMVINSNSSLIEKLSTEKEKDSEKIHKLRLALVRCEGRSKPDKPDCDNKELNKEIKQLGNELAKEKFLHEKEVVLATIKCQIKELDKAIKTLEVQNKIPCLQCRDRKVALTKKIRDQKNIKLQLETRQKQIERELKEKEFSFELASS